MGITYAASVRFGTLAIISICVVCMIICCSGHIQHSFLSHRFPSRSGLRLQKSHGPIPHNAFQVQLNSMHTLARYLRRQPQYRPFHRALAVVFEEKERHEPLLLTIDPNKRTLQFHSESSASSSSAQQIWVIPGGNHAVGVGEPSAGASLSPFEISPEGRLTFNGEEKWGYCWIPETRAVALYWFGDHSRSIPSGCFSPVQLTRIDYEFPIIEEEPQQLLGLGAKGKLLHWPSSHEVMTGEEIE